MSSAEKIISRLARVKQIGPDKWTAACPIDQSRNGRPIAVRAMPDGRTLMHAFCGCDTGDVLQTIGLTFSDLFPERQSREYRPERPSFDAAQVLDAVAHEIRVAVVIAHEITAQGSVDEELEQRLHTAARRLNAALEAIGELPVPAEIKRIRRAAAVAA
jgi:hypothetical protein